MLMKPIKITIDKAPVTPQEEVREIWLKKGENPPKVNRPMDIPPYSRISFGPIVQAESVDEGADPTKTQSTLQNANRNVGSTVTKFRSSQLNIKEYGTPLSKGDKPTVAMSLQGIE